MPSPLDSTPEDFVAKVTAWAKKAKVASREVVVLTTSYIAFEIIENWPVKTGYSRGLWVAFINGQPVTQPTLSASSPLPAIDQAIQKLRTNKTFEMINFAPYAMRIERGFVGRDSLGRNYNQAGRYIVKRALSRSKYLANLAIDQVRRNNR